MKDRKERLEDLLWIIGGCEAIIKNNQAGKFGAYPPLASTARKIQQQYIKKFERLIHGLTEEDES